MKMHFCTENPCLVKEKECVDVLKNGFETHYVDVHNLKPNDCLHSFDLDAKCKRCGKEALTGAYL